MAQISDKNSLRAFLESVGDCGWPQKDHQAVMELYKLQDCLGVKTNWIEQLLQTANDINQRLVEGSLTNFATATDDFLKVLDHCLSECEGLRSKALEFEANDYGRVVGLDQLRAQVDRLSVARQIIHSKWPRVDRNEVQAALEDLQHGRCTEYGEGSNEGNRRVRNKTADGKSRTFPGGNRTGD